MFKVIFFILILKISSVWAFITVQFIPRKKTDKDKTIVCDSDASLSGQMHRHLSPLSLPTPPLCFP